MLIGEKTSMYEYSSKRFLVYYYITPHGHINNLLSNLLYFNGLIYLISSYWPLVGEKEFEESIIFNKLIEEKLIITGHFLLDKKSLDEYSHAYSMFEEKLVNKIKSGITSKSFEKDIKYIKKMVKDQLRTAVISAHSKGINAIPVYNLNNFQKEFKEGDNQVFIITYSKLPYLQMENLNIDYLIDFFKYEETQIKRRRLFSWQNDIEYKIEKGEIKIEHIPDLIATYLDDYMTWLKKSELKLKHEKREMVYYFLTFLIMPTKLPDAIKGLFEFKKRKLDLLDDEKVSGRELAYIVHARRRFQ